MLEIKVPKTEFFDEAAESFIQIPECTIHLEHSLLSLSKWESKWHKPFISNSKKNPHSQEELLDYIRCMTLEKNVRPEVFLALSSDNIATINSYIEDPMTATTISNSSRSSINREIITSELIYYWMISLGIPFECEKWHINRLITLIRVCSAKNNPKKMSNRAILAQNRALNEARKKALGTKG